MTLLRGILLTSASWTLLTVSAAAADIPAPITKSPPVLASSWAGFYLGVHGGYGWRNSQFTQLIGTPSNLSTLGPIKSEGGVFGAHAGYNWQFGRAGTGLELDFSATDIKGSASIPAFSTGPGRTEANTTDDRVRYLGSARGRVGWLPTDTVLLYGTAGLGWERYDRTDTDSRLDSTMAPPATISFVTKSPFDRFGWVAGAGVEAMLFGPHWIGRIEYLHYDFGRAESASTLTVVGGVGSRANTGGAQTIDVVRAGLSYKFGEPAMA